MASAAVADVVHLVAARDATLVEDATGARANGAGPAMFAGRNNEDVDPRRRALVFFDVAAHLPHGAVVSRAALVLHVAPGNSSVPAEVAVHRVLEPWSEGPAAASGGSGAPAQAGDVTWVHRRYDDRHWLFPGGHFVHGASAALTVTGEGFYAWQDDPRLVADVRHWLKAPGRNFGWLLVGDESVPQSSKRIDTRESAVTAYRPVLTIEYERPAAR